jgi:hypothetical protein
VGWKKNEFGVFGGKYGTLEICSRRWEDRIKKYLNEIE